MSEGLSPFANGGACLIRTRREEAKRPPGTTVVFLLLLKDSGLGMCSFLTSGLSHQLSSSVPQAWESRG